MFFFSIDFFEHFYPLPLRIQRMDKSTVTSVTFPVIWGGPIKRCIAEWIEMVYKFRAQTFVFVWMVRLFWDHASSLSASLHSFAGLQYTRYGLIAGALQEAAPRSLSCISTVTGSSYPHISLEGSESYKRRLEEMVPSTTLSMQIRWGD